MGGGRGALLVEVRVKKGTLLSEVCVATVPTCQSSVKGVWVEGEVRYSWKYV